MKKILFLLLLLPSLIFGQGGQILSNGSGVTFINGHQLTIVLDTQKLSKIIKIFNATQGQILYDSENPTRYGGTAFPVSVNAVRGLYVNGTTVTIAAQAPTILSTDVIFCYTNILQVYSPALPAGSATAANQVLEIAKLTSIDTKVATAANQTTGNTSLSTIATNSGTQATAANQSTANTSLATIATNTTGASTAANQSTEITKLSSIITGQDLLVNPGAYRACFDLTCSGTASDIIELVGSPSKKVVVAFIQVLANTTVAGKMRADCYYRQTINTGGTATNPTVVNDNTAAPAATATLKAYTVNPTIAGGGILTNTQFNTTAILASLPQAYNYTFRASTANGKYLKDNTESLAINVSGAALAGLVVTVTVVWWEL